MVEGGALAQVYKWSGYSRRGLLFGYLFVYLSVCLSVCVFVGGGELLGELTKRCCVRHRYNMMRMINWVRDRRSLEDLATLFPIEFAQMKGYSI